MDLPIIEILKIGLSGLVFLLAFLAYRLLAREQSRDEPNSKMLRNVRLQQGQWQVFTTAEQRPAAQRGVRPGLDLRGGALGGHCRGPRPVPYVRDSLGRRSQHRWPAWQAVADRGYQCMSIQSSRTESIEAKFLCALRPSCLLLAQE